MWPGHGCTLSTPFFLQPEPHADPAVDQHAYPKQQLQLRWRLVPLEACTLAAAGRGRPCGTLRGLRRVSPSLEHGPWRAERADCPLAEGTGLGAGLGLPRAHKGPGFSPLHSSELRRTSSRSQRRLVQPCQEQRGLRDPALSRCTTLHPNFSIPPKPSARVFREPGCVAAGMALQEVQAWSSGALPRMGDTGCDGSR